MRPVILAAALVACGDPDLLSVILDEPDAGAETTDAGQAHKVPDSGTLSAQDAGNDFECVPESHNPAACFSGGCYGAVLCVRNRLVCVAPDCEVDPDPDECDLLDIVILVDRSASMVPYLESVQVATSSLTAGRGQRNLFFIDIPGISDLVDRPGPNRECYGTDTRFPIPPCLDPHAAIDQFRRATWGALEYTYDALADLRHTIQWTPGAKRHAFLFADEPGQGEYFDQDRAMTRLIGTGIKVHAFVKELRDFERIASATGGTIRPIGSGPFNPCE